MNLHVIVLAAGKGTRMRSDLPKVMHQLGGRPLLGYVLDTVQSLAPAAVHVVYGHGGEKVRAHFADAGVNWIEQTEQLGTGHAVTQGMTAVDPDATVLVVYGDVPLIRGETLAQLVETCGGTRFAMLTTRLDDPTGYGRVMRNDDHVVGVVEERDADPAQRAICEVNTGFVAVPARNLAAWLTQLRNDNAQREYYFTDIVAMAVRDGAEIVTRACHDRVEVMGVNSHSELARLERAYQLRRAESCMEEGVAIRDPSRFDARGDVRFGRDCSVDVNAVFEGPVTIGDRVHIGPGAVLRRCRVADDVVIHPFCVIEDADVGTGCRIGPYARIRPGTRLAADVHIGNFVEIKNSELGTGSKANHLAYVGDSTVGSDVNIGAGVITCNYDGANKHRTEIEDEVFVGSNSQLVAPVRIGRGATIGAGSTITGDVPAGNLAVSRAKQQNISGWKRPRKK